ncbi:hypothetical protein C8Q76DRAFT_790075 [Earliella scabrosa]|nr:hypothetical protein C8Q76DRAFT_790075 [Earliella scabrosa]
MPAAHAHITLFSRLFGQSSSPKFIAWSAFTHAMNAAGYRLQNGRGLNRRFVAQPPFRQASLSIFQPKNGLLDRRSQRHIAALLQRLHGVDFATLEHRLQRVV